MNSISPGHLGELRNYVDERIAFVRFACLYSMDLLCCHALRGEERQLQKSIEHDMSTTKKQLEQEITHLKHNTMNEMASIANEQAYD